MKEVGKGNAANKAAKKDTQATSKKRKATADKKKCGKKRKAEKGGKVKNNDRGLRQIAVSKSNYNFKYNDLLGNQKIKWLPG